MIYQKFLPSGLVTTEVPALMQMRFALHRSSRLFIIRPLNIMQEVFVLCLLVVCFLKNLIPLFQRSEYSNGRSAGRGLKIIYKMS